MHFERGIEHITCEGIDCRIGLLQIDGLGVVAVLPHYSAVVAIGCALLWLRI